MTPQERAGLAAAVTDAIRQAVAAARDDCLAMVAGLRRELEQVTRSLEQSQVRAQQAEAEVVRLQRDLDAVRELAGQPSITNAVIDSEGLLRLVQRDGATLMVRIADLPALIAEAVSDAVAQAEQRTVARMDSEFARALQRLGAAPPWSRTAIYSDSAVVSCYVGRTYVLRDGVKASLGQEPGEHPDVWERIGSHGLRVMKSRPDRLEAGDLFTEGESRFIHDGEVTTLFVPRALKQSDLDRALKPVQAEARAAAELAGQAQRGIDELQPVVRRADTAANEAQAWIGTEGNDAVIRSAQTQAWCDKRALLIDSPALKRLVDALDDDQAEAAG